MTVKDRLKLFIKKQGLAVKNFEDICGMSNGYISSMRKGLGADKLNNVLNKFPTLNREWLLYGEGEMEICSIENAVNLGKPVEVLREDLVEVRYFDLTPSASFKEFCQGESEVPDTITIQPERGETLTDEYCVFRVHGESMEPQIHSGARVLCKEIKPTKWHTLSGVIIVAYADRFVIKRILSNDLDSQNCLVLGSDNPDFPSREIAQLSQIRCIFQATRSLSQPIF